MNKKSDAIFDLSSMAANNGAVRGHVEFLAVTSLTANPENPRKHSRKQIRDIAKSIQEYGFTQPILIRKGQIVAGHGRYEAAKFLELALVPTISLDHLSEVQAKACMLADNALTDRSSWDDPKVAMLLKELSSPHLDFDIEATGFELPNIDFRIQSLDSQDIADRADEFKAASGPAVTVLGDVWQLGDHRVYCGDSLHPTTYTTLLGSEKAAAVFTDPPYNLKINGHVSGSGSVKHREFAMASGEMTPAAYTDFLTASQLLMASHSVPGALLFICIDWRHVAAMHSAGLAAGFDLLNICVWVKNNGGMGSLYRSRHEFIYVFRNGNQQHVNNIQLGRFGRNRTSVWNYPGVNGFTREGSKRVLDLHPTVKPIALVADAILDCTKPNDLVLDPYLGVGTTLIAAERTGRRCCGIELDPLHVDTGIERWQRMTHRQAHNLAGETFAELRSRRSSANAR